MLNKMAQDRLATWQVARAWPAFGLECKRIPAPQRRSGTENHGAARAANLDRPTLRRSYGIQGS